MDESPDTQLIERIVRRHVPPCFAVLRTSLISSSPTDDNPALFTVTIEIKRVNDDPDPADWAGDLATEIRAGWHAEFALCINDLGSELQQSEKVGSPAMPSVELPGGGGVSRDWPGWLRGTLSQRDERTNRYSTFGSAHGPVRAWSEQPDRATLLKHDTASLFREALSKVSVIVSPLLCVRGQALGASDARTVERLGPPDPAKVAVYPQRYNYAGEPVLYLSDSVHGICRELEKDLTVPGKKLYALDYLIPRLPRGIADLTSVVPDSIVAMTCWFAEHATCPHEPDAPWPTHIFSQAMAELACEQFDGMLTLGIHGYQTKKYSNLTIFDPNPWLDWVQSLNGPYPVVDCPDPMSPSA